MASNQLKLPALCAILPSPEKLDESRRSPGSDETNTLGDFKGIREWLKRSELRNTEWLDQRIGQTLEKSQYYPIVRYAFKDAFDPIRNTESPVLPESVFWYYAGLGLSKKAAAKLSYSSTPCLAIDRVKITSEYHEAADEFVKEFEGRKVKGGELCLHEVGFCDLYGLLKPWIAAVKAGGCGKKNKHLVIILDSCYSGIIAEELKKFEECMNKKDSTFLRENSVTIQAACGPDQGALRAFFTPCFLYFNDRDNAELLRSLKADWMGMKDKEKNRYKKLPLPSPMVVTTLPMSKRSQDVTLKLRIHNFRFTLFRDPGFFKFCVTKVNNWKMSWSDLRTKLSSIFQEQENKRSARENRYLNYIKIKFDFPKVTDK